MCRPTLAPISAHCDASHALENAIAATTCVMRKRQRERGGHVSIPVNRHTTTPINATGAT